MLVANDAGWVPCVAARSPSLKEMAETGLGRRVLQLDKVPQYSEISMLIAPRARPRMAMVIVGRIVIEGLSEPKVG